MICDKLNLTVLSAYYDLSQLYYERRKLQELKGHVQWKSKYVAAGWMAVFQGSDLPNMLSVIFYILSIPASTGNVERIFKWSDVWFVCVSV